MIRSTYWTGLTGVHLIAVQWVVPVEVNLTTIGISFKSFLFQWWLTWWNMNTNMYILGGIRTHTCWGNLKASHINGHVQPISLQMNTYKNLPLISNFHCKFFNLNFLSFVRENISFLTNDLVFTHNFFNPQLKYFEYDYYF